MPLSAALNDPKIALNGTPVLWAYYLHSSNRNFVIFRMFYSFSDFFAELVAFCVVLLAAFKPIIMIYERSK